jgi:glycosyltransferase involved in cell wall biosynthesis
MLMSADRPTRILFELRPALEGHAGIPQETRLLFRGLSAMPDTRVAGLLQSSGRLLPPGLPADAPAGSGEFSTDERVERMGRIVITLDAPFSWGEAFRTAMQTIWMASRTNFNGRETLTRFEPQFFKDFLWHRLFAKTLPPEDFDTVTGREFRIARIPWSALQICARFTKIFGAPIYPRLDTRDFDLMIAETPYPASVSPDTKLIVRYHDAIPLMMPHTISDRNYHHATHYLTLRHNVKSGAWFACVSDATRRDLLSIFPEAEPRSVTIHNMVSHHFFVEKSHPDRVLEIIAGHADEKTGLLPEPAIAFDYLLMVSSIEPRKNHLTLLTAWEKLRSERCPALKLVVVSGAGWHNETIMRKFRAWMERGDLILLRDVASADLRRLYEHARATVCPSYGEGFDFSGVEAMQSGGAVIASDIPVHREVYADAAEFFNPYSAEDLVRAICSVIDGTRAAYRQELVQRGAMVARRYAPETILRQWEGFLRSQVASP